MIKKEYLYAIGGISIALWLFKPKSGTGVLSPVRAYPGPDGVPSIRNNNPFNLIKTGEGWQGKVTDQYPVTDGFEKFVDYYHGLRAGLKSTRTQYNRGYNSIEKLINRITPPKRLGGDNPNAAVEDFIHYVAETMGHPIHTRFAWTKPNVEALTRAITKTEAGKDNFSQSEFEKVWQSV